MWFLEFRNPHPMKIIKKFLIFTVTLILSQNSLDLYGAQAIATRPVTNCSIEIGDAHISRNLFSTRGLIAVKVNAKSKCDKPIRNLVLTVEIYKEGLITNHRVSVHAISIKELIFANRIVKNQGAYVKCRTNKWTRYYGVAFAEALVEGRHMKTLPVRSENIERFQCGN